MRPTQALTMSTKKDGSVKSMSANTMVPPGQASVHGKSTGKHGGSAGKATVK